MAEFDSAGMNDLNARVIEDFRANKGVATIPPFSGMQLVLVHHVGAKSGAKRVSPLGYTLDGEDIVLIASKGGAPDNPAWYHNLLAHPDTTIELGADTIEVTAEAFTSGAERDRLYTQMAAQYPQFNEYQKNTDRTIPVVVLHRH